MKTRNVIFIVFTLWFFVDFLSAQNKAGQKPNIIFIELDDLQYEYVSFNGSKVNRTPNIDKLAQSGVFFKNAVAQGTMCGPSRNSLISGLYPHNLGFYFNGQMKSLPENVWTMPKALQKAGYFTTWIGKCHVRPYGGIKNKTEAMKEQMGFDYVKQTVGRVVLCRDLKKGKNIDNDWYVKHLKDKGELEKFLDECDKISTLPDDEYLDGFFTVSAIDFIDEYDKKEPLFLWLNYTLPHGPFNVPEKYHTYKPADMPGATTIDYHVPEALVKKTKHIRSEKEIKEHQAGFCANINFIDKQVGRIVEALKKKGIYENTLIVFFSDHGLMMGDHHRIHKGTLFRQVTNPTLVISWPARMKKNIVVDDPVELIDLIHTTLEIAGAPKKETDFRKTSVSLLPALYNGKSIDREVAFAEIEGFVMATDGKYRLIKGKKAALLFDDVKDPKNLNDIASEYPDVVKRLSAAIDQWFEKTGKPMPPRSM